MSGVQLRPHLHAALLRLRAALWPIAQAAVAAGLAWYITHDLLDHPAPFFAPIAAAIALSATVGRRWRNAVQMMFGVALGIGVSEVIVRLIGTGALPLTLIVLVTMSVAALFSSMPMFVNQAAASAILVVTLRTGGVAGERLIDALIGGACALLISLLLVPPHPIPLLARAMRRALQGVATALRAAASDLLRVIRGEEEDAAWRRAIRVRAAARSSAATERARQVAARSGAGALKRR